MADVMIPEGSGAWKMVEVKSSTSVKDYHRDDVAIQAFAAREAGVPLASVALACIDSSWTYPGGDDYEGLLVQTDLSDEAFARSIEVKEWVSAASEVAEGTDEPAVPMGPQCQDPFACGFCGYCRKALPQANHPVEWLPKLTRGQRGWIAEHGVIEMADVPDELLNTTQLRVKHCTITGAAYFDAAGARADLSGCEPPWCFLDFETVQFAVPIWPGTRPYQQIPFQFSLHLVERDGRMAARESERSCSFERGRCADTHLEIRGYGKETELEQACVQKRHGYSVRDEIVTPGLRPTDVRCSQSNRVVQTRG